MTPCEQHSNQQTSGMLFVRTRTWITLRIYLIFALATLFTVTSPASVTIGHPRKVASLEADVQNAASVNMASTAFLPSPLLRALGVAMPPTLMSMPSNVTREPTTEPCGGRRSSVVPSAPAPKTISQGAKTMSRGCSGITKECATGLRTDGSQHHSG